MTLNLSIPGQEELKPRITVFGVGGAGGNAVNNMIEKKLEGVDFVVANTDAQALQQSRAPNKIQLGVKVTEGLGAGARAEVGAAAAEESIEAIVDHLAGAHMCFITAGMGGGTGTGAAPIIAQAARELGVLTVGVVTKPFQFEGGKRMRQAEAGIEALQKVVDTLIVIPNQNLFRLANEKTTFTEAFAMADDVLYQGVKGVTDLMVCPGLINLDFADVRAVMDEMGKAMMGTGEATGEERAVQAAEKAIANPLLDEISLKGARGVLINITGGYDLTLFELDEAANRIREEVDPDANIIVGSTLDPEMEGSMRVSVVATGIDASASGGDVHVLRRPLAHPLKTSVEMENEQRAAGHRGEAEPAMGQHAPEPGAEPEAAAALREAAEPELFAHAAALPGDELVEEEPAGEMSDADLPAAAYRPSVPEFRPAPDALGLDDGDRESAPRHDGGHAAAREIPEPGLRAEHRPAAPARPAAGERSGRFGISSLINRVTGHGSTPARGAGQGASRAQVPDHHEEADEDPIEIPAFLRRQAN